MEVSSLSMRSLLRRGLSVDRQPSVDPSDRNRDDAAQPDRQRDGDDADEHGGLGHDRDEADRRQHGHEGRDGDLPERVGRECVRYSRPVGSLSHI